MARLPDAPQASSPFWWFWERFTDVHKAAYKASNGKVGGTYGKAPVALVDSVGRKSGKRRTHPLLATKDGDNIVVIASKGGVHKHPAWYLNLRANPNAGVQRGTRTIAVRAHETAGRERADLWRRLAAANRYLEPAARKAERELPIMALVPTTPPTPRP